MARVSPFAPADRKRIYFVETDVEQAHCFSLSLYIHLHYIYLFCVNLGELCCSFFFFLRLVLLEVEFSGEVFIGAAR